jgi:hypothetical protein
VETSASFEARSAPRSYPTKTTPGLLVSHKGPFYSVPPAAGFVGDSLQLGSDAGERSVSPGPAVDPVEEVRSAPKWGRGTSLLPLS